MLLETDGKDVVVTGMDTNRKEENYWLINRRSEGNECRREKMDRSREVGKDYVVV